MLSAMAIIALVQFMPSAARHQQCGCEARALLLLS
jgi:hypothetical protein